MLMLPTLEFEFLQNAFVLAPAVDVDDLQLLNELADEGVAPWKRRL